MSPSTSRPSAGLQLHLARGRRAGPCLAALLIGGLGAVIAPSFGTGCAQQPTVVATRSLEQAGRVSFLCLDSPNAKSANAAKARPVSDCTAIQVLTSKDYSLEVDAGVSEAIPHLYAMVTQTTRGEVAVIDLTAQNDSVLDADPKVPGANFLPVGAQPIDIVSTPDSLATFVGVAEVGREGLFVIPSLKISRPPEESEGQNASSVDQPVTDAPAPQLSSWPSCRLPSAPGQMLLIDDLPVDGKLRQSCDAVDGAGGGAGGEPGASNTSRYGDLSQEDKKRPKLVVAMPDDGGIAVFDAQALLDLKEGAFDPCPIERWLKLDEFAKVPDLTPPTPPSESGSACRNPDQPAELKRDYAGISRRPGGLSYAAGRLYVSDLAVPVIHVIDLPTPCEPVEIEPLLPFSALDPSRIVTTSRLAVSPSLTSDLRRYLYAVDAEDGSAMVFDVSDGATSRLPISRPHAEWNPFDPPDRVTFSAPIADLVVVQRDIPLADPATGPAVEGIRCDPNPVLRCDDPSKIPCDVAAAYRTATSYDSGAGPIKLRGMFALLALTSGKIAVVDIDDYDAPCRRPSSFSSLLGCEPQCKTDTDCRIGVCGGGVCTKRCNSNNTDCPSNSFCTTDGFCSLVSSQELSCNVVMPNTARTSNYDITGTLTGQREAGIQTFPLLYDKNGTLISTGNAAPRMVATLPQDPKSVVFTLPVGTETIPLDIASGKSSGDSDKNTLAMNREDPRAQLVDQNWSVTFEGPLPGFRQQVGNLHFPIDSADGGAMPDGLYAADGHFCDAGVQSQGSVSEQLTARGQSDADAARLADYVQIADALPAEEDPYWQTQPGGQPLACTFAQCKTAFGDIDAPLTGRDFLITEAYQDHVELKPRDLALASSTGSNAQADYLRLTKCCFPTQVSFNIRAGGQWVVTGDASGFFHHVIADPEKGVCRNSCESVMARRNGRVIEVKAGQAVHDGDVRAFINPMFRFAVQQGTTASQRDDQFRFITQGSFNPLLITIATDTTTLIQPVAIAVVPIRRQEVAVTDGAFSGLTLVSLSSASALRQYY